MSTPEPLNQEAVLLYFDGAREALAHAQFNLDGGIHSVAINRAYYAFFYAATALLLTIDLTRSKHSGVMSTFREHFVRSGTFSVRDSDAYGRAFQLRNITDYRMAGKADAAEARAVIEDASCSVSHCQTYLSEKGYL